MARPSPDHDLTVLRRAGPADASAIAEIHIASFRATYDFPLAHPDDEVRQWVDANLLPETQTWVADLGGAVVGYLSLRDGWVEHLYVARGHTGNGIGSRLIRLAKETFPAGLQLWTFQVNDGARRFYERHGFTAVEMTDGASNEEHQPDVRYAWK